MGRGDRAPWGAARRDRALHGATARSRQLSLDAVSGEAHSPARQGPPRPAAWDSPEAATYTRELVRVLLEVIDELPPTFRDVVRLRDVEDRPPEEVARRLHISSSNVAVRLHRAHKLLRPRLLRRLPESAAANRPRDKNL